MKFDAEFLKAVAKHPVFYIMIALVFGISFVFEKYTRKTDENDQDCKDREKEYRIRITSLEAQLDRHVNTILLQKGEITNRNEIIDSIKNNNNENF